MKFTNYFFAAVHVSGYGWIQPGDSFDVPKADKKTINSISGLSFFQDTGDASTKKVTSKKSPKGDK